MTPRRPEVLISVPLEGLPTVRFLCDSAEDEERLRRWLRHASALQGLPDLVRRLAGEQPQRMGTATP
jgi:hypothetical protein